MDQRQSLLITGDISDAITPNEAQVEALGQLVALRQRGERRAAVIAATVLAAGILLSASALADTPPRLISLSSIVQTPAIGRTWYSSALIRSLLDHPAT